MTKVDKFIKFLFKRCTTIQVCCCIFAFIVIGISHIAGVKFDDTWALISVIPLLIYLWLCIIFGIIFIIKILKHKIH